MTKKVLKTYYKYLTNIIIFGMTCFKIAFVIKVPGVLYTTFIFFTNGSNRLEHLLFPYTTTWV
jgi:hypothetical protein